MSPTGPRPLNGAPDAPARKMPESDSKEAAIEAAVLSMSPTKSPKLPKPILKAPSFELGQEMEESSAEGKRDVEEDEDRNGPLFNPVTMVGEAASESKAASALSATNA